MAEFLKLCVVLVTLFSFETSEAIRRKRSHLGGGAGGGPPRSFPGQSSGGGGGFPSGGGGGGYPSSGNGGGFPSSGSGGGFPSSGNKGGDFKPSSGGGGYPSGGSGGGSFPSRSGGGSFPSSGGGSSGGFPSGGGGSSGGYPSGGGGGGPRQGGGRSSELCTEPTGDLPYAQDCSRYVRCDNGKASIQRCPDGLFFNPATRFCDWPGTVDCPQSRQAGNQSPQCQNSRHAGSPHGYQVPHPEFCNAYYTCSGGHMDGQCMFCGEDEYFDETESRCVDARNGDLRSFCGNRRYIEHVDKTRTQQEPTCNLNLAGNNPFSQQPSQNRGGNDLWNPSGGNGGNRQGQTGSGSSGSGMFGSGSSGSGMFGSGMSGSGMSGSGMSGSGMSGSGMSGSGGSGCSCNSCRC